MSAVITASSVAAGENHQPLHVVAELAHIAGPVVGLQHRHGVVADAPLRQAGRLGNLFHEIGRPAPPRPRAARPAAAPGSAPPTGGDRGPRGTGRPRSPLRDCGCVEVMIRTLTSTLVVPPARWNVWSTSTRRILFWVSRGRSPISSMNSVPPWASSSAPILRGLRAVDLLDCRTARFPSAPA